MPWLCPSPLLVLRSSGNLLDRMITVGLRGDIGRMEGARIPPLLRGGGRPVEDGSWIAAAERMARAAGGVMRIVWAGASATSRARLPGFPNTRCRANPALEWPPGLLPRTHPLCFFHQILISLPHFGHLYRFSAQSMPFPSPAPAAPPTAPIFVKVGFFSISKPQFGHCIHKPPLKKSPKISFPVFPLLSVHLSSHEHRRKACGGRGIGEKCTVGGETCLWQLDRAKFFFPLREWDGLRTPVSRLAISVFPAPFGP